MVKLGQVQLSFAIPKMVINKTPKDSWGIHKTSFFLKSTKEMQSFHGHGMFHAAQSSSNHAASLYCDKRGVANFSKGYESWVMNVVRVVQFAAK